MALRVDLTFDCAGAAELAEFWKLALGYEDEPPPAPFMTRDEWSAPFMTRDEWAASFGESEEDEGDGAWVRDPRGVGPRLVFLEVPEPKVAKNRLHIDVRVGRDGSVEEVWERVEAKVAQLVGAGASVLTVAGTHHVVLADPEGNEFCVAG